MPLLLLLRWLFGALSLGVLATGGWLVYEWWDGDLTQERWLLLGVGLLLLSFLGRPLVLLLIGRGGRRPAPPEGRREQLAGPDGATLAVERLGQGAGPVLVLTHGWGLDRTVWDAVAVRLAPRHPILRWDLPGLGHSKRAPDAKITLERFADDLAAVAAQAGGPVVLVGHSIGGMTIQTLMRRGPLADVAGLVLVNTSHARPDRTSLWSGLVTALRPLIMALCRVQIGLAPVAWLSKWQSYLSGSAHLAHRIGGFGSDAARWQIEQSARLATKANPAVEARGMLAMLTWDATDSLGRLHAPVLVITGGKDKLTKPEAGRRIAAAAGVEPVHVERAGHMGLTEQADVYAGAIERFVSDLPAR